MFVTLYNDESGIPLKLKDYMRFLDEPYPEMEIEYVKVKGDFLPEQIVALAKKRIISANLTFIGSPSGA